MVLVAFQNFISVHEINNIIFDVDLIDWLIKRSWGNRKGLALIQLKFQFDHSKNGYILSKVDKI